MPRLHLNGYVSCSGSLDKPNEDRFGHSGGFAFVIDGATGLGERQYMTDHDSDAQWFAHFACDYLLSNAGVDNDFQAVIRALMEQARTIFMKTAGEKDVPRFAWPSASLAFVRVNGGELEFFGLGDCVAYIRKPGAAARKYSALRDFAQLESDHARQQLQRNEANAKLSLLENPATLESLRAARSLQNTPESGIWTLGMVPDAAAHVTAIAMPVETRTDILLCSDGFSALEETYGAYDPDAFLAAAKDSGLEMLYSRLRRIEDADDPQALRYPRFKKNDDATALFLSVTA